MTVDLAEEHSTATLATERLELETNERLRLENEVQHLQVTIVPSYITQYFSFEASSEWIDFMCLCFLGQNQHKKLQESSEKLETELLCMKTAEVNGVMGLEDDDSLSTADESSSGNGGVYKQRYERAMRELEYTKRRLQQQHHDDLEQLIALRKQLEKKVSRSWIVLFTRG